MDNNIFVPGFKIHFIGIGGISMSALARILLGDGCIVTGSDMRASHITARLEEAGAKITIGHSADNITDQNLVVYTSAVKEDNPEYIRAKELGIPLAERAELLGAIMKRYEVPFAISGTHGKTSTTGMLSQIFLSAGKNPTVTIGGELDSIGGNLRVGGKEIFIAEACEYHRSFLKFSPKISLILNIEEDHLDYYKDIDDIISAFHDLALLTPPDGFVIANIDDKNVQKALCNVDKNIVTFAVNSDADYTARNITPDKLGFCAYDVYKKGSLLTHISLSVPGVHNVYDSLAAFAAADVSGIDVAIIDNALHQYVGVHRRFEKKGYYNNAVFVDDYAHHPSEIRATLTAASKMGFNRVFCVFQPHTYTRTKALFNDFVSVLTQSRFNIIVTDIYAAREKDTGLVSAKELSDAIINSIYIKTFDEIETYLKENVAEGDMVITMGAGDVYKIGENVINSERSQNGYGVY
ncbi:MAG: UDP-N-acetylmuramate--L-alanine ligase [Clostridia bacterium]|nr:UDP-N-acetylmuramate--L-alanine ligase [Clostridia bacterium]